jgi:hypothetical protein
MGVGGCNDGGLDARDTEPSERTFDLSREEDLADEVV